MPLLYHAYVYLEFLILACTIYILAPGIAKVKLVDRIYYKSGKDGLTWEQLAVENF